MLFLSRAACSGRVSLVPFAALGLVLVVSLPARAEDATRAPASSDVARAESYAADAFEAYSNTDFERAVSLYQQALDAAPSADILYNLARIYDSKLEDREHATEYYQRYVDAPDADPARVHTARERLQRLRGMPSVAPELRPATPVPATPPPARPRPASSLSGARIAGIVLGAVGIIAIGVGGGLAFSAKADADVTHELCDGNACISQRGVDAAHDAETKANIATAGIIGGGVLAAAGLTLFVFGGRSSEQDVAALHIAPAAGPGLLGTQLSGRF